MNGKHTEDSLLPWLEHVQAGSHLVAVVELFDVAAQSHDVYVCVFLKSDGVKMADDRCDRGHLSQFVTAFQLRNDHPGKRDSEAAHRCKCTMLTGAAWRM